MLKLVRLKEERDGGVGVHPSAGDEDHCSHPTVVSLCVCVCGGSMGGWEEVRRHYYWDTNNGRLNDQVHIEDKQLEIE